MPLLLLLSVAILLLLLLQQQRCCFLPLFVYRVPDGKICCWFIESDSSVFLLLMQRRFSFYVPLGSNAVMSHLRPRYAYILGNFGHARSQGGRQTAAAKPPLYQYFYKRK